MEVIIDDKIINLKVSLESELSASMNLVDLDKIRVAYLGKKGQRNGTFKGNERPYKRGEKGIR